MKLLWALVASILAFFVITGATFLLSPGGPLSGDPVVVQLGSHCTPAQMQQVNDFYGIGPQPANAYAAYLLWLGHGLSRQWVPQLQNCGIQFVSGEPSASDFWLAVLTWGVLAAALASYSLWTRRGTQTTSESGPQ